MGYQDDYMAFCSTDAVSINIEHFHSINEMKGREFGDQVLHALGDEILRYLSETNGIAGRFEADNFHIFCKPQGNYQTMLETLQNRVNEHVPNANVRLRMGVMPWEEGLEPIRMFDRANTANSKASSSERRLVVYDETMQLQELLEARLLNDLERALREREFKVYYQPKYDIQCEPPRLSSAEALIRREHPELGLLRPSDFIPVFEEAGQICVVDKYVWRETARQIAAWKETFGMAVPVSVNLSRIDALDPTLEETIDGLKMDRAFVRNIEHSEKYKRLVDLILDIARNLQVPVVAEGVETEEQLMLLKRSGCALVQGFYFARPLSAADFEATILRSA